MRTRDQLRSRLATAVVLAFSVLSLAGLAAAEEQFLSGKAKAVIARSAGIPLEQLTVGAVIAVAGTEITGFKVWDAQGSVHSVYLDARGGQVAREMVERAVGEFITRGFVGKYEEELADRLSVRNSSTLGTAGDMIDVVYWLKEPVNLPRRKGAATPELLAAHLELLHTRIASAQERIVRRLEVTGQEIRYRAMYAPVIVAAGTAAAIRAVAGDFDVERIYLARIYKTQLNVSRNIVQASEFISELGTNFSRVRVGVVEPGKIATIASLPSDRRVPARFSVGRTGRSVCVDAPPDPNSLSESTSLRDGHKTRVANIISGRRREVEIKGKKTRIEGIAPGVTLVDGITPPFVDNNGVVHADQMQAADAIAAIECVIRKGATVINLSLANEQTPFYTGLAATVDFLAYTQRVTFVAAAGNACGSVGAPAVAFNALAVGAFFDNNTPMIDSDDLHGCDPTLITRLRGATTSAFGNPNSPRADREEPDVVAPGVLIRTFDDKDALVQANGTSFAAPHVTGGVALLQGLSETLLDQPERIRAILMAAARRNIEGDRRLSEHDGVGGILLAAAARVLLEGESWWFQPRLNRRPSFFPHAENFRARKGQRVRVALVWANKVSKAPASEPEGNARFPQPTTDLDMFVCSASGERCLGSGPAEFAVGSASADNNYEIVDFEAPATGTYKVVIKHFKRVGVKPSPGEEHIGLAVSRFDTLRTQTQ